MLEKITKNNKMFPKELEKTHRRVLRPLEDGDDLTIIRFKNFSQIKKVKKRLKQKNIWFYSPKKKPRTIVIYAKDFDRLVLNTAQKKDVAQQYSDVSWIETTPATA